MFRFLLLLQELDGALVLELMGVFIAPYAPVIALILTVSIGFIVLAYVVSLRK